jgi:hypothetical protein
MKASVLMVLACLFGLGCGLVEVPQDRGNAREVQPVAPTTVLGVLAERAGQRASYYSTTDDLMRVVNKLAEAGDITANQLDAIKTKLGTARRPLTPQDLAAIRGL